VFFGAKKFGGGRSLGTKIDGAVASWASKVTIHYGKVDSVLRARHTWDEKRAGWIDGNLFWGSGGAGSKYPRARRVVPNLRAVSRGCET
jgi:hypothetical protein